MPRCPHDPQTWPPTFGHSRNRTEGSAPEEIQGHTTVEKKKQVENPEKCKIESEDCGENLQVQLGFFCS